MHLCLPGSYSTYLIHTRYTTNSHNSIVSVEHIRTYYTAPPPQLYFDPIAIQPTKMTPNTYIAKPMWRKRYIVPLWTVQLLATGIFFIVACVVLSYANDPDVEVAGYSGYFV